MDVAIWDAVAAGGNVGLMVVGYAVVRLLASSEQHHKRIKRVERHLWPDVFGSDHD